MENQRIIRIATPADMVGIMQVMDAAKQIMRKSGNFYQWTEGYPSETVIIEDMEKEAGYVIEECKRIVAYFAFHFGNALTFGVELKLYLESQKLPYDYPFPFVKKDHQNLL